MGLKSLLRDIVFIFIGYNLISYSISGEANLFYLGLFGVIIMLFSIWFLVGRFFGG